MDRAQHTNPPCQAPCWCFLRVSVLPTASHTAFFRAPWQPAHPVNQKGGVYRCVSGLQPQPCLLWPF